MLVIIASMPRSGSTWLGKLFDSHNDVLYMHEPDSVLPRNDVPLLLSNSSADLEAAVEAWLNVEDEKVLASRPIFEKDGRGFIAQKAFETSAFAAKAALRLGLPSFGMPYCTRFNARLCAWKSIESVGRMPALLQDSDMRGIHLVRHPCGQIASTLKGSEQGAFGGSLKIWDDEDLFRKLLLQHGDAAYSIDEVMAASPEERLAIRWGLMNDYSYSRLASSECYRLLRYEDLCEKPRETVEELFEFCKLPPCEQTQRYVESSTGKHSDEYYSTNKDPLRAANKWRETLPTATQTKVMDVVQEFECGRLFSL